MLMIKHIFLKCHKILATYVADAICLGKQLLLVHITSAESLSTFRKRLNANLFSISFRVYFLTWIFN